MMDYSYKNFLIFGICVLFLGATIAPNIGAYENEVNISSTKESAASIPLAGDFINAFWEFDDCSGNTVEDSSAHNYDGMRYGATWTTNGYQGCALDFDGVDDYVDLTSHVKKIAVNKTDDYIISFYFKTTQNDHGIILSYCGYKNVPEFRIEIQPNGSLLFKIWTGLCGMILFSDEGHNDGSWHEIQILFSGITTDPTMWIWIDDNLAGELTDWLCDIENSDFLAAAIGKRASDSSGFFDGIIDEFKFIKYDGGNDQIPPEISGPTSGEEGVEYEYTFITDDPEGDEVEVKIDWGDGEISEWLGPVDSGDSLTASHSWDEEGQYFIKAKSKDFWDDSHWTSQVDAYEVRIGNQAPSKPIILGPRYGDPDQELTFSFTSWDYEDQDLYYIVDWDDGTTTETGFYPSNTTIQLSHSWDTENDYFITARALDIHEKPSGVSDPLWIRIGDEPPRKPDIDGPITGGAGEEIDFMFTANDPEDDMVSFNIKWGDGEEIEDTVLYTSGETITIPHIWESTGTFFVEARAKDMFGFWSTWESYQIKIPRIRGSTYNVFENLFERFPNAFPILKYLLGM